LALFFAISGTAIALPGRNSVDSGDIKPGNVRTSDLKRAAVKRVKLAPNSVDSSRVLADSLTGGDIDESTLVLPQNAIGAETIGPGEEANRTRRVVFPAAAIDPGSAQAGNQLSFAVLNFDPSTSQFASISTETPIDRVAGTDLTLRLIWSASGAGSVSWHLQRHVAAVGEDIGSGFAALDATTPNAGPNIANSTAFTIPSAAIQNGDLIGFSIERSAGISADTLTSPARLHLVELDYMATD